MKIKDILQITPKDEIEAVIKIGEYSEQSANEEISNYIVTNKIAQHLATFIRNFQSRQKETGIWLSGFYGSGKSYFAKILGLLLENPSLMGVSARDKFKNRLTGLENQELLENKIESLSKLKTKVVPFDLSGESSTNSFYKILLLNFLKSIGLTKDFIGFLEFQIQKSGTDKYKKFLQLAEENSDNGWKKDRQNTLYARSIIKKSVIELDGISDAEYDQTKGDINRAIDTIDADNLIRELNSYLELESNDYDRIIFIVDEVSEALDKEHLDITELRGAAQHLTDNGKGKFWLLATAQEKMDKILDQQNIGQNDINIITDRFQTKLHLASEEVNKVIKQRILSKTEEGKKELEKFYNKHEGKILTLTKLEGDYDTTIENTQEFIDYYPFFPYQMRLLKDFLFAIFQQAKAGSSERGMIVTIDKILKEENMFEKEIGEFATAYNLEKEGFPLPESEIEEKFHGAQLDMKDENLNIHGDKLLRTVFFLEKSKKLKRSSDNIAKAYNNKLQYINELKKDIEKALDLLESKNQLLSENGQYKITSEKEEKLMKEMRGINLPWGDRIGVIREILKQWSLISNLQNINYDGKSYQVKIIDEADVPLARNQGEVTLKVINVLNINQELQDYLDEQKEQMVTKDVALLVPAITEKEEINRLVERFERHKQIINRHRNTTIEDERKIISNFELIKNQAHDNIEMKLKHCYTEGYVLYDYKEHKLEKNNITAKITEIEKAMIDKTFEFRLSGSFDDRNIKKYLSLDGKELHKYCPGDQFNFFDKQGEFVGNNLLTVSQIKSFCDSKNGEMGKDIEDHFKRSPFGWAVEDIRGTLAAMLRAGKIKVKHQGNYYRDYTEEVFKNIFSNIHDFRNSRFYYIQSSDEMGLHKKQQVVDKLLEINQEDNEVDYNMTDYQIIKHIQKLSGEYVRRFHILDTSLPNNVLPEKPQISILTLFSEKDYMDSNMSDEADEFLNNYDKIWTAINYINDVERFRNHKLEQFQAQERFIKNVQTSLDQVDSEQKDKLLKEIKAYSKMKDKGIIENIDSLTAQFNTIRQIFNEIFADYFDQLKKGYKELKNISLAKKKEIADYPKEENKSMLEQIDNYVGRAEKLLKHNFRLAQEEPKEANTHKSINEVIQAIEIVKIRIQEVKNYIPKTEAGSSTKPYRVALPAHTNNISVFRSKLKKILTEIKEQDYDSIEITIEE